MATQEGALVEFGRMVRERRVEKRLSVRALAEMTGVSASYISAIETGHNATTGRAPEPSIGVAERLLKALDLPPIQLERLCRYQDTQAPHHGDHWLLYRLGTRGSLKPILDELFADRVDQWFCIADPRTAPEVSDGLICWHWPFGSEPYPNDYLEPARILESLECELMKCARLVKPKRPGLVIADCSTVMRWVVNPECEVDFESRWAEVSGDVVKRVYGRSPIANVCVYDHSDMESLSARLDLLETILQLFSSHASVAALDSDNHIRKGPSAVATILRECRPAGVSTTAWRSLTSAAAMSYAGGSR